MTEFKKKKRKTRLWQFLAVFFIIFLITGFGWYIYSNDFLSIWWKNLTNQELQSNSTWLSDLPDSVKNDILWMGDHEEGNLSDWTDESYIYPGGGIFNTGGDEVWAEIDSEIIHSGNYSVKTVITGAYRSQNGNRAVRLMRWTNKAWDDDGEYFPEEFYCSVWMYLPETYNPNKYPPWDPGDGGWWNVFQFKSDDLEGISQPVNVLNIEYNEEATQMEFYIYSNYNPPHSYSQPNPKPVPANQWIHVEAFVKQSNNSKGRLIIWQDGIEIFDLTDVKTFLTESVTWGIGSYTDHIALADGTEEGNATIYYDDAIVSNIPLHDYR